MHVTKEEIYERLLEHTVGNTPEAVKARLARDGVIPFLEAVMKEQARDIDRVVVLDAVNVAVALIYCQLVVWMGTPENSKEHVPELANELGLRLTNSMIEWLVPYYERIREDEEEIKE